MSERTGLSVSQVTDEVLYTGLIEMQELPELDEWGGGGGGGGVHWPRPHPTTFSYCSKLSQKYEGNNIFLYLFQF